MPLDARSDVYALGVLAFEMLTGNVPFHDEDPMTVIQMHQQAAVPPLPQSIPYSVQQIVRRALEKEPNRRYQSAGEMMQHCQQVFAEVSGGVASVGAAGVPRTVFAAPGMAPQGAPGMGPPGMGPPGMALPTLGVPVRPAGPMPPSSAAAPGRNKTAVLQPSGAAAPDRNKTAVLQPSGGAASVARTGPVARSGSSTGQAATLPMEAAASRHAQPAVMVRSMGLGAGGQINQRIYSDPYGIETWDEAACATVFIHIVSPQTWYELTGEPPPPTPITFRTYQAASLPWFQIYDEDLPGIAASHELEKIRSIDELDRRRRG